MAAPTSAPGAENLIFVPVPGQRDEWAAQAGDRNTPGRMPLAYRRADLPGPIREHPERIGSVHTRQMDPVNSAGPRSRAGDSIPHPSSGESS